MKNKNIYAYGALGVLFALFNVLAFVIPTEKTTSFWIAHAFTIVAFILLALVWHFALAKRPTLKSKFLGIPLIHIGVIYLVAQLIAFAIVKANPLIAEWLTVVICVLILGIFALFNIAGQAGAEELNCVDEKIKAKKFYIQSLQVDMEMIAENESDPEIKAALKKLAEKIRFSDSMSYESLGELEAKIRDKVEELKTADDKISIVNKIDLLLTERNKKCKLLK